MVVVCLSVRLSVTDVLWLRFRSLAKTIHKVLAMRVKLGWAKFRPSNARGTFSNCGLNGRGVDNSMENRPYLGNGVRYGQGYYYSLIGSAIRTVK